MACDEGGGGEPGSSRRRKSMRPAEVITEDGGEEEEDRRVDSISSLGVTSIVEMLKRKRFVTISLNMPTVLKHVSGAMALKLESDAAARVVRQRV